MDGVSEVCLEEVWRCLKAPVPGDTEGDWCTAENNYQVYQALGAVLQPNSILEIGTRVGHSLIALASDNPRLRRIEWIDNESYIRGSNVRAKANVLGFYGRFRPEWPVPDIQSGRSYPPVSQLDGRFELCHIDGDHSYEGKLSDLDFCSSIHPTWIIADDYDYLPTVGAALRDWCAWFGLPLYHLRTFRGLALIPLHRPLESWTIDKLTSVTEVTVV